MRQILNISRRFKSCHFRHLSCSSLAGSGCQQEKWGNVKLKHYKQTQSQGVNHHYMPHRYFSSESEVVEKTNNSLKSLTPNEFLSEMKKENISRCYIANLGGELKYSHNMLENLFKEAELKEHEFEHEAIFFNIGRITGCLMAAVIWKTHRGQGVGGVDYRPLTSMAELILEGNRFSKGLGIKAALAGMWAGGGKGFIISPEDGQFDLEYRQKAFLDYGDFLTSLNGCFVAGAGIGSSVSDMDNMFTGSRYVSNISPDYGGSVNSSHSTGLGVVTAMEAALEFLMMGTLEGKTVAIQGAGNVGQVIIEELLKKDVKRIFVSECNSIRADDVNDMFANKADGRLTVLKVSFEDTSIFRTPCDIFAPCARGKIFEINRKIYQVLLPKMVLA